MEGMDSANNMSLKEDEAVVDSVEAKKDSVTGKVNWERCPSGYICKLCNKQYKILNKCEFHIQSHLGVRPYECQLCKRRYLKMRILNEQYFSSHMGEKLYKCKLCDSSYRHRKNFKKHAETHEELRSSYLCDVCKKKFNFQFDYWKHVSSTHIIVKSEMAEGKKLETKSQH
jgi:uncharacterized C2H2 Zn-finger protein